MKQRIWELDTARGICILGMLAVHFLYDMGSFYPALDLSQTPVFSFLTNWGGVVFFLISGVCVTLGSRPILRGAFVFGCGLVVSAVTAAMVWLGFSGHGSIIYFGVLHCLGACMLLWPVFRKLPPWGLGILAAVFITAGEMICRHTFPWSKFLFPLGFRAPDFVSTDYFPLLPFLGFFLVGSFLGKTLYKQKVTLFPDVNTRSPLIRFFSLTGRWSLPIYLLHQPVLIAIFFLAEVLI